MKNRFIKYIAYIIIVITFISSCVTKDNYKYLSLVFDGVPNPNIKEKLENDINDSVLVTEVKDTTNIKPLVYKHTPYASKKCNTCHNQKLMGSLVLEQPKLCYQCHNDLTDNHDVMHGPVGGGYCTACHNPHKAKDEHLLLNQGQKLCFNCHDSTMVNSNKFHDKIEATTSCTECHNPHGGGNRYIMQEGACYKCHVNFKEKYAFIHGPVIGNHCNTCHSPHATKTDKLLLRSQQQLCLHCHNSNLVYQSKSHENIEKNCTECHNPHGGDNRYILN